MVEFKNFNLFEGDQIRDLSNDADVEAIEGFSDDQRALIFDCIKHVNASTDCMERTRLARIEVRRLEAELSAAQSAHDGVKPRLTVDRLGKLVEATGKMAEVNIPPAVREARAREAARLVSDAQKPGYRPKKVKPDPQRAKIDILNAELANARTVLNQETSAYTGLQKRAGEAINQLRIAQNAYLDPTLPEHIARSRGRDKLMRETLASQNAARKARIDAGEHPDAAKAKPPAYQSALDRERGEMTRKAKASRPVRVL
jgi:hypothetical protein